MLAGLSLRRSPVLTMGLNPYRKFVPRRSDYVFVGAAVLLTIALLVWALLG